MPSAPPLPSRPGRIPRGVWALGLVSLCMDFSSEMIHSLLPVYLVTVLGASALTVGFIEGIAEATANITKVFSGALSDWLGRRKLLTVIGYGLATVSKPVFALATTISPVVGARFMDRVGKGIRGAPRDALMADITPAHLRGASFGLRQALDTVGAFLGPLVALGLMLVTANAFRTVFWIATIPAIVAMVLLVWGVQEPKRSTATSVRQTPRLAELGRMSRAYWMVVLVAAILTLARFSEAFLVLRAQDVGLRLALIPLVLVVMNVVYAAVAYPAGTLADRFGRRGMLVVGMVCLLMADLILAFGDNLLTTFLGIALWGIHMGFTQGIFAALVADTAPTALRGSAFGLFHLATGVSMLGASIIAGALWEVYGPAATFMAGAVITGIALLSVVGLLDDSTHRPIGPAR